MLLVKANRVAFDLADKKMWRAPASYGLIHDPEGKDIPRCDVLIGPYTVLSRRPPEKTRAAIRYFGENHRHKPVRVNIPDGPWVPVGTVHKIYYVRTGKRAPGGFHHPFQRGVALTKCGRFYKLSLGSGCLIDDRGFLFP